MWFLSSRPSFPNNTHFAIFPLLSTPLNFRTSRVPRSSFAWAGMFIRHRLHQDQEIIFPHALGTEALPAIESITFPDFQLLPPQTEIQRRRIP